jgi:nitrate reductase assembly molybdenum cofactor insertion protein NarJ
LDGVHEMNRLLGNATNNINQIARRLNETGSIYTADIAEIQSRQDEIWVQQKEILSNLNKLLGVLYNQKR